jgi:dihydroneopterin aldolase
LQLSASVGVLPEERERRQPIEIDLDLDVDTERAASSDDLDDAVDYGAVCAAVEQVVLAGHVQLLERLAAMVADVAFGVDPRVVAVDVAVRKLEPPVPQQLRTAGVRLRRAR